MIMKDITPGFRNPVGDGIIPPPQGWHIGDLLFFYNHPILGRSQLGLQVSQNEGIIKVLLLKLMPNGHK